MIEVISPPDIKPSRQIVLVGKPPRFTPKHKAALKVGGSVLRKHSSAFRAGVGFMSLAAVAGAAHLLAAKHGLDNGHDHWGRAAYLGAYIAAWFAFLVASSRSIVFGVSMGCAYLIAERFSLASQGNLRTLLLLTVASVAVRVLFVMFKAAANGFGHSDPDPNTFH